jgi:antitoxin component of MazEF toxin-antitoxin module
VRLLGVRKLRIAIGGMARGKYVESWGITLPKKAIEEIGWELGDQLEIWHDEKNDVLVIRNLTKRRKA